MINEQDEKTDDRLLIIAYGYFNESIIRFLICNGVDINISNKSNKKANDLIKHTKKINNSDVSLNNNRSNASSGLNIDDSFGQFNEAQQFNTNKILNMFESEKHDSVVDSELTGGEEDEDKDGDGAVNVFIALRSAISTSALFGNVSVNTLRLKASKVEKNNNGDNGGYNVIVMHFLYQYLLLLMIPQLIQIILHQLLIILIILIVLIDNLHSSSHLVMIIYITIKIQWTFYHLTRVFLLLLLFLLLKTIESMDIALVQLNYDLIQAFICLFAFNCVITNIHWLEQLLFVINCTNNKKEFFHGFFAAFFVVFYTPQHEYERKNGSGKATNASLMEKPNGTIVNIIVIEQVQALLTRLVWIQVITSIVLNMVLHIIDINFQRKSSLDMNKHQNIIVNHHIIYTLLSQQKYYKSSYIVL